MSTATIPDRGIALDPRSLTRLGQAVILCILTVAVCFARRPDQFLHPYIYAEDGAIILRGYAERGLISVIEPINGYLNLTARVLSLAAFKISFLRAPEISSTLAIAFTCLVVVAIATSPTLMRWPFLCAILPLIVPSDPEVFGVALYSFWWAGLLLVLAVMWESQRGHAWLRAAYLVVGGLSSPLIVPFTGLLFLRAAIERRSSEFVATAIAAGMAAIQLATMLANPPISQPSALDPSLFADTFAGIFVGGVPGNRISYYHPGLIALAVLLVSAWLVRRRLSWHMALLAIAWCAVCLSVILRVGDLHILSPITAGPRYFFYPYVIFMWIAVWIAAESNMIVRALMACCLALGLYAMRQHLSRSHDPMDWRAQVATCARSELYPLPIHSDGKIANLWHVELTGAQCRAMITESLFDRTIAE